MEIDRAKEIIRTLADGRDPATGEQFPPNSPYQQADTVRALFMAVDALDNSARRARRQALRPGGVPGSPDLSGRSPEGRRPIDPNRPKIGASWSPEEEQQLRDAFAAHKPIPAIAAAHGRTQGAITARLVKLGLIEAPATNRVDQPPSPIRPNRLPSEASAQEGPTRHGVAPEQSRVPSDSSAPRPAPTAPRELTPAEKTDFPF
jgi:hypothetical protein